MATNNIRARLRKDIALLLQHRDFLRDTEDDRWDELAGMLWRGDTPVTTLRHVLWQYLRMGDARIKCERKINKLQADDPDVWVRAIDEPVVVEQVRKGYVHLPARSPEERKIIARRKAKAYYDKHYRKIQPGEKLAG